MTICFGSCRTGVVVVESSRTELDDDVIDVTSFSMLDVGEIRRCRRRRRRRRHRRRRRRRDDDPRVKS